ncbi:unnamed protein product [Acanthoscelides obtectus]|uniref:Uncharacterized protein n=1 Tax=Acanthoscelides obtectus TaxID=200917 RepID=A0A9P0MCP6_ACAOB|nr:unnamed protein product [Acanthoscelides obtectus]CAK1675327.1 hypothetical protein AOBTE_LOCUS30139 [Acanthoscelides obtectus]
MRTAMIAAKSSLIHLVFASKENVNVSHCRALDNSSLLIIQECKIN